MLHNFEESSLCNAKSKRGFSSNLVVVSEYVNLMLKGIQVCL